ncbi:MAG: hypothetical protein ACRD3T_01980 [Terriglobia bacterium]
MKTKDRSFLRVFGRTRRGTDLCLSELLRLFARTGPRDPRQRRDLGCRAGGNDEFQKGLFKKTHISLIINDNNWNKPIQTQNKPTEKLSNLFNINELHRFRGKIQATYSRSISYKRTGAMVGVAGNLNAKL